MKTSCFCYSLEHGGSIIGILTLVWSAVVALMQAGVLAEWKDVSLNIQNVQLRSGLMYYIISRMAVNLIQMASCVVLLKGIKKGKSVYLIPWICWTFVLIFVDFSFVVFFLTVSKAMIVYKIQVPIYYLLLCSLRIYCIVCINVLRKALKHRQEQQPEVVNNPEELIQLETVMLRPQKKKVFPNSIWEFER